MLIKSINLHRYDQCGNHLEEGKESISNCEFFSYSDRTRNRTFVLIYIDIAQHPTNIDETKKNE